MLACGFEETIVLKNVAFGTFVSSQIVFVKISENS